MDFIGTPLFSAMKAKLSYLSERQGVLAQNVANADLPDYKAKDIATPDFKKMLAGGYSPAAQGLRGQTGIALATTDAKHITASATSGGAYGIITRASTYELNPSGNNVSIEEEMAKISDNQAEYNKVLNMYRKTVDMFKTAIGKNSG